MMPDFKKGFDLLDDDKVNLCTENESMKTKLNSYEENWLEESKTNHLKQIVDEKKANLIMS